MPSTTIIPFDDPDWESGSGRAEIVDNMCLGSTVSGPRGVIAYPDSWFAIQVRANSIWINYWDSPQNGDAEIMLTHRAATIRHANLSSLVSYSTGGCVRQSLLGKVSSSYDVWVSIDPLPPADETNLNGRALVFSSIEYALDDESDTAQTSLPGTATGGPKYVPSAPTPNSTGTPQAVADVPPPSGGSGVHSKTAAMLGGIIAGVLAMAALLAVLVMLRRRRRKQAARMTIDPDWPDHPVVVRSATLPHDAGIEHLFTAVPTDDPDERPSDAPVVAPSIAPDEASSCSPSTCATAPPLVKESKPKVLTAPQEQENSTPGGPATSSAPIQYRPLSTSTGVPHRAAGEITWEEPPPEYST